MISQCICYINNNKKAVNALCTSNSNNNNK